MYSFFRAVLWAAFHILTRVHIAGRENVPARGALLLVTNHLSRLDPPLIFIGVPRQVRVFIALKYHGVLPLRWFVDSLDAIWVRQNEADVSALKQALAHLLQGGVLGVSPEGTRSQRTHALIRGQSGAAFLADRAGASILPVAVWGTEHAFQSMGRLRRPDVHLRIGKPFRLPAEGHARGAQLEIFTEQIMCAIAALLPEPYRGVYAHHPGTAEQERQMST
ncbi:MAG: lysophospholipid acyltransferase family protein [Anaerolineales bacterium]|jgi:1-acyl-sn-glycerol-3-phosphate acyltransferase